MAFVGEVIEVETEGEPKNSEWVLLRSLGRAPDSSSERE